MAFLDNINRLDGKPETKLSKEIVGILQSQTITASEPGSITQDVQTLLDIIGADGILSSGKLCHIPNKLLPEINQRLRQPIETALKRPSQKSYASIHGLYLLLRTTGLVLVTGQGKSQKLIVNQEILPAWQQLNPTERYFTLLEAWLVKSYGDTLGESQGRSSFTEGSRILMRWPRVMKDKKSSFANYAEQDNFTYSMEYYSIALMEMFGMIRINHGKPDADKGWRIKSIEVLPWGKAIMEWFGELYMNTFLLFGTETEIRKTSSIVQPLLSYYFPEWQQILSIPTMPFRAGLHIFKVSLGKCWRRIAMAGDATLWDFSRLILESVDFDDDHLDMFTYTDLIGHTENISHPYSEDEISTDEVQIGDIPLRIGAVIQYLFDFGDCWRFDILLENIEEDGLVNDTESSSGKILESHGKAPKQYPDEDWDDEESEDEDD
jgi:Plasmid pRiA4b ORF-3-like protein